jgi:integrase
VANYLNAWLETRQLAPSTRERYRKPIADFLEYLGNRAELPISNVTPGDVTEWGRRKLALGYSAVTVRTDRKAISPAFAQATREGLLLTNPVTLAEPIDGESEKREPFTGEEVARLTEATAGTEWGTVVRIAAATGLRLGDAVNLQWEDFDLFNGILDIRPEKSRRKKRNLKIPLAGSLREYLAGLGPKETGKLTPGLSRLESKGNGAASKAFLKIMESAGIDSLPVKAEGKGRGFHRKSFHSFRHYFISELGRRGVPSDVSQALAGHSSPAVHAAYKHFDPETLAAAVATL